MQQYFSSHKTSSKEEQENLEIEMEHLLLFLENVDFEYLRHQYPQLAGIEDTRVYLEVGHANNNFIILVDKLVINIPESINRKLNQTELTIEKE